MDASPISVPTYHALGEAGLLSKRTELLYGLVYAKIRKVPLHSALAGRLAHLISEVAETDNSFVRLEQPITCIDSEPEPDIAVVRGTPEDYRSEHPTTAELVLEVCVTSHDFDLHKIAAYASAGVKECWYVLAPEKQIEIHSKPVAGQFTEQKVFRSGEKATSQSVPGFIVDLDRLITKIKKPAGNSPPAG
jgi:Uma2 family endonuclease